MNKKIIAAVLAIVGVALWFQPLREFGMFVQTGQQLDQVAFGLLAFPVLFALAVWAGQKTLSLVSALLYVVLAGYYVYEFGINNIGWGLMGIVVCAVASLFVSSLKK